MAFGRTSLFNKPLEFPLTSVNDTSSQVCLRYLTYETAPFVF